MDEELGEWVIRFVERAYLCRTRRERLSAVDGVERFLSHFRSRERTCVLFHWLFDLGGCVIVSGDGSIVELSRLCGLSRKCVSGHLSALSRCPVVGRGLRYVCVPRGGVGL